MPASTLRKDEQTLLASAARTTSGTQEFTLEDCLDAVLFLDVSAAGGTTPTLDLKVQEKIPGTSTWVDVPNGAFTQSTGVVGRRLALSAPLSRTARLSWTIAGTTPSFTFSVAAVKRRGE